MRRGDGVYKYEQCKNCIYCKKLYVPSCNCYENIPKKSFVCTLFLNAGRVMYMESDKSVCEVFTRKEKREEKKDD